ncbi:peroxisomal membrane anchor protein conserved region-domain-containing protein [Gilbertella persicaria]|uniref:peroxisomal membrane anchor protein conserved region-domain-containing protein n=1 Tax=Gilbertella persicaria TaxID=101096 RepID=UPI002220C1B2|nr:peroxisomal membrane anchor protein conserved region-domain-containing protein [Gilbertella persicaria]KAI8084409.1 peroxisomal membrane anchor protein conserved region-domain-containing protein [Gilbertella persicaria]
MSDSSSSSVQTLNKVPNKQETASANSTPAPSTPANTTPSVPTASTNNTPAPSTPANSNPVPSTPASTTPSVPAASANTPSPTTNSNNAVLREDLIKPAVSFLSSPNVRSADKEKKISFLQKKGLNQAEIDEAFKRAGNGTVSTSNNTSTHQQNTLAPIVPARNVNYVPPQIVYYPQPPPPPVPAEKVFAMAVVLGMGAVGLTAGVIGLLRVSVKGGCPICSKHGLIALYFACFQSHCRISAYTLQST